MTRPSDRSSSVAAQPSRREFVKTSSAIIAGGAALAAGVDIAKAAHVAGDEEIKVALIGCGGRGTSAAAQALSTQGKVTLWAMADAFEGNIAGSLRRIRGGVEDGYDSQKMGPIEDRFKITPERQFSGFDAYQKAIDSGVDLVILATPPGFRPLHFEAIVAAGKHAFIEKPLAVDAPGIRRMLAAGKLAEEKGLAVGVGLQRHHQAGYIETIKRLKDGAIGDIPLTRVYWNSGGVWVRTRSDFYDTFGHEPTEMEYQMNNWYYFNWLCGDHILEQHIHNIDVSNWLKDAHPIKANGMGGRQVRTGKDHGQIFDHHAVEFTYADGSTMLSQCRHIQGCDRLVDEFATGTKGSVHIGPGSKKNPGHQIITPAGEWTYSGSKADPYQVEHDDLFAAIRKGDHYNEVEYGAHSTMTSILGRMATYSGKNVTWDEAINSKIDLSPAKYDFAADPPVMPDADGNYPVAVPGKTLVI